MDRLFWALSNSFFCKTSGNRKGHFVAFSDRLNMLREAIEPYASPVRLWLGPKLFLFVKHPDHIQASSQQSTIKVTHVLSNSGSLIFEQDHGEGRHLQVPGAVPRPRTFHIVG